MHVTNNKTPVSNCLDQMVRQAETSSGWQRFVTNVHILLHPLSLRADYDLAFPIFMIFHKFI